MKFLGNIGDVPVSQIMRQGFFSVKPNFSIRSTIESLQMHNMNCAPVVNEQSLLIGIISEHDLLIQAASKQMSLPITYTDKVISVKTTTSIKEVLTIFYTKRLKFLPVVDGTDHLRGVVTRIDVLGYLAKNAS